MYIIIEMQTTNNTTSILADAYADVNIAYQKYYTVLAAAAVSNVPIHTAMMVTDSGLLMKTDSFKH